MKVGNLPVGKVFFSLALVLVKLPQHMKNIFPQHANNSMQEDPCAMIFVPLA